MIKKFTHAHDFFRKVPLLKKTPGPKDTGVRSRIIFTTEQNYNIIARSTSQREKYEKMINPDRNQVTGQHYILRVQNRLPKNIPILHCTLALLQSDISITKIFQSTLPAYITAQ